MYFECNNNKKKKRSECKFELRNILRLMKKNNKGNATSHIDSENNDSDLRKQEKEYFEEGSAFVEDFDISEGSIPREKFIFGEEDQSGESSSSSAHPDFENALNS